MAEYICKVGTEGGRVFNETVEAFSEAELRQRLRAQGYYVFSIRPKEGLRARLPVPGRGRISTDDFVIFNQQFLTLSKSGLPLQKALDLLARQTHQEDLRASIEDIRERVRAGSLLSEAFEATGKFPKIYCATLRAGERSGSLDRVLAQYIAYQKTTRTFRKKFLSALVYPVFLLFFLVVLVAFVIWFIVPRFALLYADLGVELPELTQFVIQFSLGVKDFGAILLAAAIGGVLVFRAGRKLPAVRLAGDRIKFRLPVAGKLLLKFSVAEFARTLSVLLQGGIPAVSALDTAKDSVSSPVLSLAIAQARADVTGGRSLASSLRQTGFFPDTALDMIEVGENTGALPGMLESLAEFYEEDVNIDLSTLVALVDPIMIASIAVVVAFVLIAFYLPLFSMAAQVR